MMDPLIESPDNDDEEEELNTTKNSIISREIDPIDEKKTLLLGSGSGGGGDSSQVEKELQEWKRGSRQKKKKKSSRSSQHRSSSQNNSLSLGSWSIQFGGDSETDENDHVRLKKNNKSNSSGTRIRSSRNKSGSKNDGGGGGGDNENDSNNETGYDDEEVATDGEVINKSSGEDSQHKMFLGKKRKKRSRKDRSVGSSVGLSHYLKSHTNKLIILSCAIVAYLMYSASSTNNIVTPDARTVSSKSSGGDVVESSDEGKKIRDDIMKLGQQMVELREKLNNPSVGAEDVENISKHVSKLQESIDQQTKLLDVLTDHFQGQGQQQQQQGGGQAATESAAVSAGPPMQSSDSNEGGGGGGAPSSEVKGSGDQQQQQQQAAGGDQKQQSSPPPPPKFNIDSYFPDDGEHKFDPPLDKLRFVTEIPIDPSDKVFIWAVPLVGISTIQGIFDYCFEKVRAAKIRDPPSLELIDFNENLKLVNMDTSDKNTITMAQKEGLMDFESLDFVVSTFFHDASGLFTNNHHGRAIALLRNPIERSIAMYEKLRELDDDVSNMSLLDYAQSSYFEDNWMCRYLTNTMQGKITDTHVVMATQILRNKVIVGLADQPVTFMENVARYLNLESMGQNECVNNYLQSDNEMHNRFPAVTQDSEEFQTIKERNMFDMKLFENARMIFTAQRKMLGLA